MEIKEIRKVFAVTTDGKEIPEGALVVYTTREGRTVIAYYHGMDKRGALVFQPLINSLSTYTVMPKTVTFICLWENVGGLYES